MIWCGSKGARIPWTPKTTLSTLATGLIDVRNQVKNMELEKNVANVVKGLDQVPPTTSGVVGIAGQGKKQTRKKEDNTESLLGVVAGKGADKGKGKDKAGHPRQ